MKTKNLEYNHQLAFYFKTLRAIHGYTLEKVAKGIYVTCSSVFRIENASIVISDESLKELKRFYEVDNLVTYDRKVYDELDICIDNLIAVDKSNKQSRVNIKDLTQLALPYLYLNEFISKMLFNNIDDEIYQIVEVLDCVYNFFENRYQEVYLILRGFLYYQQQDYENAKIKLEESKKAFENNECLNGLRLYYEIMIENANKNNFNVLDKCKKAKEIFAKYNLKKRLTKIQITEANSYSNAGMYEYAINLYKQVLVGINDSYLEEITVFNIANQYANLKQYRKAIEYYLRSYELEKNNMTAFEIAWCYYNLNQHTKALEFIEESEACKVYNQYYVLLNQWLKHMINKKYSNKCLDVLKRVEKKYSKTMHSGSLLFVYQQLEDYYQYHEMYKEAYYYSKLINEVYRKF